ncbi:hypothetical protein OIU85_005995 [Salix viminalis]|uniref:Hemerythrin-like domain-containing protein n=1 Tax=Salix viminalis TaxID=40686 RepID=A0A9Q0PJY4_SALVM|nr:hypothetical protein OIU85_005995 [Salix viminalis]
MATPFSGIDRGGAGGVAVLAGPVNPIDPAAPSKTCLKSSALKSPILIFLFFHKAIRSELDGLHSAAIAFATTGGDIKPLFERYQFFRSIYKHHCNAEDEMVKNQHVLLGLLEPKQQVLEEIKYSVP